MAAFGCRTSPQLCWRNITMYTICFHLLIVISLPTYSLSTGPVPLNGDKATASPPVKRTGGLMASHTAHTVAPPNPTAGLICGKYSTKDYNLTTLISAQYWTLEKTGVCYDTRGSSTKCDFSFAFCKYLPPDIVSNKTGIGAAQLSDKSGSQPILLGDESHFNQNEDEKGLQLVVSFHQGDSVTCAGQEANLQVELHLHCNKDATWHIPFVGTPGVFPSATLVAFDDNLCKYTIETDYDGACGNGPGPGQVVTLSPGTIIIIVFFGLVVIYLVVGMIYNMSTGAKGLEVIPNYDMWSMFPANVLGGVAFVWGIITCQGMRSQKPTYDDL